MAMKLISYDLNKTGKAYEEVIEYIQSLGAWATPLKSQFFVSTDLNNAQIIAGLQSHGADDNDSLLVIDVTGDHVAWSGIQVEVSDWMKKNL